ncbi:MAG: acyloxyacyl hydrolase [Paludibacteraceae bacterium]
MCTFLFLLPALNMQAELSLDCRAMLRAGAIMPDGKVDVMVGDKGAWTGPSLGADLSVTFYPQWQALDDWSISFRPRVDRHGNPVPHRQAGMGVGLSYWCFGQNALLGHAIAPYLYLDIPLVSLPHFVLGLRPGIGLGFLTKTYRNTVPEGHMFQDLVEANRCVGSVTNFHFPEALYMEFPIRNGWSIAVEGGWYHFSNGSTVQPNSGYNTFAASLGARKTIDAQQGGAVSRPPQRETLGTRENSPAPLAGRGQGGGAIPGTQASPPASSSPSLRREVRGESKSWSLEFALAAGARQVYYRDQATFAVGEFQAAAYWLAHPIFRLGGGLDLFYDGAYKQRATHFGKTYLAAAKPSDCWRLGVSLQPEFVIGQFTAGFHVGFYLLDPVKELEPADEAKASSTGRIENKGIFYRYDLLNAGSAGYPDGWLYTQIVLRYRLPYHLFLQANMKAHITKVEFVSLGIGVYI